MINFFNIFEYRLVVEIIKHIEYQNLIYMWFIYFKHSTGSAQLDKINLNNFYN